MYGVDENVSSAMRLLMMGDPAKAGIYGTTAEAKVPGYLMSIGAMPYLTQSFNNWLLGWQDAATGGWLSLETNETYYGSGGVANGDGTNYTMCTGEVDTCDKGETLARTLDPTLVAKRRHDAATYGLIMPESLVDTTGGFLTGTGDKVDVSGYAIADITRRHQRSQGHPGGRLFGFVVATERNIQANLLETFTLLDATPGALHLFGGEISMQVEQLSGLITLVPLNQRLLGHPCPHQSSQHPNMSDLVRV